MTEAKSVLRETDTEAVRGAKRLIRSARFGALAVIAAADGAPGVSRVGVSTDYDGVPVILISGLAPHSAALRADPRCGLLLGEPGRGDPLAHARISLTCRAVEITRGGAEHERIGARYLSHQPKAKLYADLGDFRYFRLEPVSASLNGGFGRAYALSAADLMTSAAAGLEIAAGEMAALAHMNADHAAAVAGYARHFAKAPEGDWRLVGIDAEGMDLALGEETRRVFFAAPLGSAADVHRVLVAMAREARAMGNQGAG